MTSSLLAHSYENPFSFKSTQDWAVSVPAVPPDCHLWKLISQKSIPSFQSRNVLFCSTNSATTPGLLRGEKSKIQIAKINTCGANESRFFFHVWILLFNYEKSNLSTSNLLSLLFLEVYLCFCEYPPSIMLTFKAPHTEYNLPPCVAWDQKPEILFSKRRLRRCSVLHKQ